MVATSARMAVLTALAALLALPSTAGAALDFGSCVDFKTARCASLTVPLDRSGVDPGTIDLRIGRAVLRDGRVYVGTTRWAGAVAFRPAFVNWQTTIADADLMLETIRELGQSLM